MDELEISGKRYLSTRRAAKEHKYTSDYVGQLIRGGKVVGKKVGRSWYVDEESLNAYLNGESAVPEKPKEENKPVEHLVEESTQAPTPKGVGEPTKSVGFEEVNKVEETAEKEKEEPAPLKTDVEEKTFEPVIVKKKNLEEHYIPVRTSTVPAKEKQASGLRYIVDDEPALPEVKRKSAVTTAPAITARRVTTENAKQENEYQEAAPRKNIGALAIVILVIVAIVTLSITAVISSTLNSRIVVEQGQVAGVGYSFR